MTQRLDRDPEKAPVVIEWNETIARFLIFCQHELQFLDRPPNPVFVVSEWTRSTGHVSGCMS